MDDAPCADGVARNAGQPDANVALPASFVVEPDAQKHDRAVGLALPRHKNPLDENARDDCGPVVGSARYGPDQVLETRSKLICDGG